MYYFCSLFQITVSFIIRVIAWINLILQIIQANEVVSAVMTQERAQETGDSSQNNWYIVSSRCHELLYIQLYVMFLPASVISFSYSVLIVLKLN